MTDRTSGGEDRTLRNHLIGGTVIALVLSFGIGGWAATTELSGAITASGSVVVDSNVKKVQHLTGGLVGELMVREGDRVRIGDTLVRLDETVLRAGLAIYTKGLDEMRARKARLAGERDGADHIVVPPELLSPLVARTYVGAGRNASCSSCGVLRAGPKITASPADRAARR
jgi:HlyD family secretion protein